MAKPYDLSKPLVALDHDTTLVAIVEMSGTSWLGLAIAKPTADLLGHFLTVKSTLGRGSCFAVRGPLSRNGDG